MRFRLIQDGQPVAWATSEREIAHYALIYAEDGPVQIESRLERERWKPHPTPPVRDDMEN